MAEPGARAGWPLRVPAAAALVAAGLGVGALLWRSPVRSAGPAAMPETSTSEASASTAHGGLTLTPEMAARAGIKTVEAVAGTMTGRLRIPGVVTPNRYKQVAVTSLVSGRLTQVRAELGQRVERGQVLATLYSPELADAQTAYVTLHAELTEHDSRLIRTQRLATIGAASRQELEMLSSDHARLEAAVEAARSRLVLLGVPAAQVEALSTDHKVTTDAEITAPAAGVVIERAANPGLNIDPATPLFSIVDLATVWIIGDVYERDFASVNVGTPVTITTSAYPGLAIEGQASYIDPQLQEATRTAKLRIEVPNPGGQLRLGMYVEISVEHPSSEAAVLVPRSAIQTVGNTRVVYVAATHQPGHYIERPVEIAETSGDQVRIVSGIAAGELVVTEGAFFLRAERARAPAP
jgi:RND family efflux transporter MFP subunit